MTEKQELRRLCRIARRTLSETMIRDRSARIAQRVLASSVWAEASSIALYWALPDEVQTEMLCQTALSQGKAVYLPRVLGPTCLGFFAYTAATRLEKSRLGVLEPTVDSPRLPAGLSDLLCIVPGLGFDRCGMRLGFGGGYYDRFLGSGCVSRSLGLCFACQVLSHIPREAWDQGVDLLCTEEELIWC